ncbi:hypothetical protein [Indioceanicola profundi]|uniref:hypothetical protein n=1 Tax=Indioceanicola profundi TaxID=2220096 RepID=UPI0013C49461|nr:hypothetical protein [Indioceanicola profundi]
MGWGRMAACCAALALSGCAAPRPADPPVYFGSGRGSSVGNWIGVGTGETRIGPQGQVCDVYFWDRPVGNGQAVRLRSGSCPIPGRPGLFSLHDYGRSLIPLAESLVPAQPPPEPLPADPVSRTAPAPTVERKPLG